MTSCPLDKRGESSGAVDYTDIDELAEDERKEEKEKYYQKGIKLLSKQQTTGVGRYSSGDSRIQIHVHACNFHCCNRL